MLDQIVYFIEAMRNQTDMIISLSTIGIGAVLFSWLRSNKIINDDSFSGFRCSNILVIPLLFFIVASVSGYTIYAGITGFWNEVVTVHAQTGNPIEDPIDHFKREYEGNLYILGMVQVFSSCMGLLSLSAWYVWNAVYRGRQN